MKFLATLLALAASVLPAESLTASEGEAFGKSILSAMTKTLATGSMEKMADEYFADEIEWIWSGPQVGKGHKSKLVAEFAGSWGAMVSAFNPAPSTMTIVDTPANKISVAFDVTITLDGHVLSPCYVTLTNIFSFTLDEKGKVTLWEGMWDSGLPQMKHCIGLVMAHKQGDL